jgi:allophanate hydrolase
VWITRIAPAGPEATSGPLAGATLAVKDNIDVAGVPTTAGHPAFAYTPTASAIVVQRLVDAGAVVVGKTNLDQFATGLVGTRSPFGACRNPYAPDRIAGGSSCGSAVAVATGEADLALTTDTAGSGRVPAALCGIVGVKPTRGLVSTRGVVPAIAGLDCVGVVARTVALAATAIEAATAFDPADPWSRRPPVSTPTLGGSLRVGVPRGASLAGLDPPAAAAWADALASLAALGPVDEVDLSAYLEAGELLYGGAIVAARWHAFGEFLASHPEGADPTVRSIVAASAQLPAHRLVADVGRLQSLRRLFEAVWEAVDVLAVPTVGSAPTLDEVAADPVGVNAALGRWTCGANLLDLCAVAAPCGWRSDGVPFGVTFIGPPFGDARTIAAAARLTGEPDPPPPSWTGWVPLVVVGAHLSGQPLNEHLTERGGVLARAVATAPCYRLYALATDPPKPGLVRVAEGDGGSIAGELWLLPVAGFGDFVHRLPSPMCVGTVLLDDGSEQPGFLCEPSAIAHTRDITGFGGWVSYLRGTPA